MHLPFHAPPLARSAIVVLLSLATILAACNTPPSTPATGNPGTSTTGTAPTGGSVICEKDPNGPGCQPGTGIQDAQLFIEPAAAEKPILDAIKSAKQTITLEMYLLTDRSVIQALEDAAHRGISVRVLLEGHPAGSGSVSPQQTIAALNAAGVQAKEANPVYHYTHAKTMVIDVQTAVISSANFTKTALGGTSYGSDRDFVVIDPNQQDAQECAAIFEADWNRVFPALSNPNLVVSPVNARIKWLALINSAKSTLRLEQEEMQDQQVIDALIAAAQRGVKVGVVVPKPAANSTEYQTERRLQTAGVRVTQVNDRATGAPYIHAKTIIVDTTIAFVGSENVSSNSLDNNREIGILIANAAIIQQLTATFTQDFGGNL